MWVPINKQLWTTSFAVLMAGLAAIGLACSIWLVDGRQLQRWFTPLEIFGLNAIAAYLISTLRDERAAGARHGKIVVHRRPRARGEPGKRVTAIRDGGAGCRLPGGLAHGSPGLVSEIIAEP